MLAYLLYTCHEIVDKVQCIETNDQKVDTFTIQGAGAETNRYIFGNVAFYTFKCYKKRKRTKKPFISLNDFFWWLSRNKRPKEPFRLFFFIF